nr:non-ribosomal peptide synthetase [Photorhabdus aballayi]
MADKAGYAALGEKALDGVTVLDPNTSVNQLGNNPTVPTLISRHLACVIYTSGSTGTPKGVMVEHRGLVNLIQEKITQFCINPESRVLQFASLGFDASIWEIMIALGGGASLVIAADTVRHDPHRLWDYLEQQAVTHITLPPALLQDGANLPPLTTRPTVILCGEAPSAVLLQALCDRVILFNAYGPTESTVCATIWRCPSGYTDALVPIGYPTANSQVYLLDADGQPVPLGAEGELYIGGVGVARGYLNRPDLTAERFLADPFSEMPDARMYRTGDLARYLPDGSLVFIGRNDRQVKIRGFRIEPGEIEARLTEFPAVREAAVLALGDDYDKRLVAYVVAEADDELVNNLRIHLNTRLPDYMVPAAFVRLDAFPLTPNGKLDRKVLPVPGEEAFAHQIYEAPQGEIEIALAAIWHELLGIEQVSRHDNFFALGGHSLLAVRMMNRIATLGVELPLSTLFESPSLIAFAEAIRAQLNKQGSVLPAIMPISREGELPLSFAQQRLWFLSQLEGVSETYHIPMALHLRGQLNISVLQQTLDTLFSRHEALRSIFISVDGQPQVKLLSAELGLPMKKYDLSKAFDMDEQLKHLCVQEAKTPFDFACGPLIRSTLIQLADNDYVFLLTQHHIVSDGWSAGVLISELSSLYKAFLAGQPDPLPQLTIQYPDYAAWQRQWLLAERIQIQSDYWRTVLVDAPILLDLPTDRPRPSEQTFAGNIVPINLDENLTASLKRLSEQQGTTLFMTLLSAWAIVLSRLAGHDDVVIGTPSAGRSLQEVESLIGFFVNTLALRIDLSGAPNVVELLARVRQTALAAQEHQDLPFEQVVEIVQPPRCLAHTPLFQVMFTWQNNEHANWGLQGLVVSPITPFFDTVKFDLELDLSEEEGRIEGVLSYATALFDQSTIERYAGYLHTVLQAMVANPQQAVGKIDILTPVERRLLLATWNTPEVLHSDALCIHQLFERQVEKKPDAIALVYQEQVISYAELNARANRLAHQLIILGIEPDQRVTICVTRSPAMVIGLLAVLKAGGAYVPLDPTYPVERLAYMLKDAAPLVVLADKTGRVAMGEKALAELVVLDPNIMPDQPDTNPLVTALIPYHLAYVIYTSGSTGTPKGVMVEHQAVYQRIQGLNKTYEVTAQDRVLQFSSFAFDASVEEFFSSLCNGATLVMRDSNWLSSIQEFISLTWENRITVMSLPTLFLSELTARDNTLPLPGCLRLIIIGGEAVKKRAIQDWFAQETYRPRLLNTYGPTENTVIATCKEIVFPEDEGLIGRPVSNTNIYLLDRCGQPVPLGCTGEIYIGGVGVARGYLNQSTLTAERFLSDPFSDKPDARMYRTGDLARYLPDGNLVFMGRNDQQVKIRGFRIELGEIEARLTEHPAVIEVVVLALGEGTDKRLIAWVVTEERDELANSLRTHLRTMLPDYMVPAAFVRLDAIPLTPNGKLDLQSLPVPDEVAFARQVYEAPQGETEITLATIWRELLGIEQISRYDSFFALGGHSLLAVRMVERLRNLGLTLAVRDLFQHPVLFELARTLGQHRAVVVPTNVITPETTMLTPTMLPLIDLTQTDVDRIIEQVPGGLTNIQDIYALSPLQDGILFHHLLENEGDLYLLANQMSFTDRHYLDRYLTAVQQVVDRHDILRTAFIWQGLSVPAQVVCRQAKLSVTELMLNPADGPICDQLIQRFDPHRHRIDLSQAPLLHFVIAQEWDDRWIVLQLQHHLIGDHTTQEVMDHEIQAYMTGQGNSLPAPVPFRNFVAQTRLGVSQTEHTRFFTDMLAEVEEPTLSFGVTKVHYDGSQVAELHRMLASELNERLRSWARHQGVSLAALCHLAWAQVLSRTSGQEKVVFGTVLFGRMQAGEGFDSGMGLFINTLPLQLDMDDTPVQESVREAHNRLAGLLAHEHASLALAQRCSRVASGTPLFNALLNYRHNVPLTASDEPLNGIEFLGAQERTNYPIVLSVEDFGDALGLTAQVVQPFEPARICDYMQQALESLAEALEHTPDRPVRALEILPEAERTLLLKTWNATETVYPDQLCIYQLFEQQVERTPDATALIYEEQTLSYTELNAWANRLAHQLIMLGVEPDQRVAICVTRSPAMVIGLLAVLKAGGAYVPLDPTYPGERLAYMLKDTAPSVVLADVTGQTALGEKALAELVVLDPNILPDQPDTNLLMTELMPHHLAYVIYTSGSTGTPKGVMLEHRGVCNYLLWARRDYLAERQFDSIVSSPLAFDATVTSLYLPLLCGGKIRLLRDGQELVELLPALLSMESGALVKITPSHLLAVGQELKTAGRKCPTHCFVVGGETLPSSTVELWRTLSPGSRIINEYGPTETVVGCAVFDTNYPSYFVDNVPIGRPISNTQIYILDPHGEPVPMGVAGELYIGGVAVARGYLNRPELTAERFLVDPFSDKPGARMYRTGDLARYLPDGNLVFIGRNDHQVKIRGFRIEPGEIESRLTKHPAVSEVVVLSQGEGQHKRLVAYIVAESDDRLVTSLRTYLSKVLPDYMIPAAFVCLDALPLTPNGKLDRQALPIPGEETFVHQVYVAPQGRVEIALAEIWQELLKVEQVGRHDNFFVLGGHSLLAIQMINLAAKRGMFCTLNELFQFPVLSELAVKIMSDWLSQKRSAIPVRSGGTQLPLFCVPSGVGDYSYTFGLAELMRPDYPIYALPWPPINEERISTMEMLATRVISLMKAVQPKGPYRICGYSSGGILAYAVAQRLLGIGDKVDFLGLIDTLAPHCFKRMAQPKHQFLTELENQSGNKHTTEISALYPIIDELSWMQLIEFAKKIGIYSLNLSSDLIAKNMEQRENYEQMVRNYVPETLTVPLHQFYALEPSLTMPIVTDTEQEPLTKDPSLGWNQVMPATLLQLIAIVGNHSSLFEDNENRMVLAQAFDTALASSDEREGV